MQNPTSMLKRYAPQQLLLFAVLCFVSASWWHFAATQNLRVDDNPLPPVAMVGCLVLVITGLIVGTWVYWQILTRRNNYDLSPEALRRLAYMTLGLASFMLPILSNDIFSVLAYGDLTAHGYNPYTNTQALAGTSYYEYVSPLYRTIPCVYGPVNLFVASVAAFIGGGSPLTGILVYKLLSFLLLAGMIEVVTRHTQSFFLKGWNLQAAILLSPLLWIQGAGQNHNDVFGTCALAVGVFLLRKDNFISACVFFTLAFLTKLSFALFLPLPLVWCIWVERFEWMQIVKQSMKAALVCVPLLVLAYLPFKVNLETFLQPFISLSNLRPSGTFPDIIGELTIHIIKFISPNFCADDAAWDALKVAIWAKAILSFKVFGLGLILYLLAKLRDMRQPQTAFMLFVAVFVAFIGFFSHRFFSWYLLVALPLLAETPHRTWLRWFTLMSMVSVAQDFSLIAPRGGVVAGTLIAITTVGTLFLLLWRFKRRFIEL